jgi:anti-sigma B factor antagonist
MYDGGACHCNLTIRREGVGVVVAVGGELDLASAPEVARAMRDLLEDQAHLDVVLDLGGVTFIDSSGVSAILDAHSALCGRNGRITISHPSASVQRVFHILGLDDPVHVQTLAEPDEAEDHQGVGEPAAVGDSGSISSS